MLRLKNANAIENTFVLCFTGLGEIKLRPVNWQYCEPVVGAELVAGSPQSKTFGLHHSKN